ncbi:peptidoglycan D,D-transpeptidase FtsI family protein [Virgibacillus alimentarius]|uniref:serine-type D-Ala-D-Ala carboxypeptidase n=1 Tax=Virgibacillus alimentarius TaxID=698769 RepID=A0ABS4S4V3_9BACI|nr:MULTISPECIES: penicillin-binding protein 2 [Virgibacillus]MBP2256518.1 cell division protein FtsI/penicillin-binding protein 2 [Virgibacillus alimentarius]HLR66464.1 penicillin-binding protein 2 [Virgibacillus sp.]
MKNKKRKKRPQLPFRLNIIFFIVFLLFCGLILQLGVVQILHGEGFQEEIDRTIKDTTKIPVPRGLIVDRNQNVIVDNKPLYSITYTPAKGTQAEDKLKVAEKLAEYISMDSKERIDGLTERNKKEYWYLKNKKEADKRLSEEEANEMSNAEQYDTILDRITEKEISDFTKQELEVMVIKKELDKAYSLTPQIIKNEDVTPKEYARVAEHLDQLPGVNATTDWNRSYPFKDSFKSLLGSITSQEEGLPAEKIDYFLTRGYSRNDRVGKSGLEEQYEEVLRGRKEQVQYTTTKSGQVIDSEVIVEGQRGKDLVLTIDMELQKRVDKIVKKELKTAIQKHPHANRFLNDAFAVVINPQTGELLAVSGQHYDREEGKFENAAYKALYEAHRPGSSIKGATIAAGYQSDVISPGQTFYDAPIKIAGTPEKSSVSNLGSINDINALKRSSNVYMFYIAMRMGGEYDYQRGKSIQFNPESVQEIRNYFHQFGLGVSTGVDFPYEATGYVGQTPPNLLDFSIGQYDTYTTMQLAQYISTIASDGYRVRPHFVKEIRDPDSEGEGTGPIQKSINTKVLNKIGIKDENLNRIQEGFRKAFQETGGTASSYFSGKDYDPAGKTGTAQHEVYEDGKKLAETENLTLVGYAPFDEPEVAFAVVVPNTGNVSGQHPINNLIGEKILDEYFDLKEERDKKSKKENN